MAEILYNVTVKIDHSVEKDWLQWMQEKHIPDVMKTGYFLSNSIFRVMIDETDGVTYSVQYRAMNMADIEEYQEKHAARLQKEHTEKYANKFVAFRTLLEKVS